MRLPVSHLETHAEETEHFSASFSCVKPRRFLISLILLPNDDISIPPSSNIVPTFTLNLHELIRTCIYFSARVLYNGKNSWRRCGNLINTYSPMQDILSHLLKEESHHMWLGRNRARFFWTFTYILWQRFSALFWRCTTAIHLSAPR